MKNSETNNKSSEIEIKSWPLSITQAFLAMKKGKKITHITFEKNKYYRWSDLWAAIIVNEKNEEITDSHFKHLHMDGIYKNNWAIFDNKKPIKYRLEYNEQEGFFHFEDIKANNENTNGYKTICKKISVEQCIEFTDLIYNKYLDDNKSPTYITVLQDFVDFLRS